MDTKYLIGALAGIGGILALKYLVVGLCAWDQTLHPGRIEPASLRAFQKPFLGNLKNCPKCSKFWGLA
jgi:hypothetical protein